MRQPRVTSRKGKKLHAEHAATASCNISNPETRTGSDFKSKEFVPFRGEAQEWNKLRGLEIWSSPSFRIWNDISYEYSLYWINFDPVLGLYFFLTSPRTRLNFDPILGLGSKYFTPDIQCHHVNKIELFVWLISSWIINEYEIHTQKRTTCQQVVLATSL